MTALKIPEDVLWRDLNGEGVLLDLRSGRYFGLNATGALIWDLLKAGADRDGVVAGLVEEFDVDRVRAEADYDTFVGALLERGLLLDDPSHA